MFRTDDTIVAISSAGGEAARAIVRLSGPEAIRLTQEVFDPSEARVGEMPGFRSVDGVVRIDSLGIQLPARVYLFRSPRSFTRDDVTELHLPGSPDAANSLISELIDRGARQASPGEFTARAFFSGRIDLSGAEGVADIVNAADDAQLRAAVATVAGRVERICGDLGCFLGDILAGVEASIDLAEEKLELDDPKELARELIDLSGRLERTANEAALIPEEAQRPIVVLTGRTNVGKSSLLNALTGTDRAIVSALAGTTRDVLTATMVLPRTGSVSLLDAAGFAHRQTPLEAAAHDAAQKALRRADLVLFVLDTADPGSFGEDLKLLAEVRRVAPRTPLLLLANKIDLLADERTVQLNEIEGRFDLSAMATSALTAEGLDAVRNAISESLQLVGSAAPEALGLHERQKRCLLNAARSTREAARTLQNARETSDVAEVVAIDLREALAEVGQISGQIVTEDILGRIFARFCVGK